MEIDLRFMKKLPWSAPKLTKTSVGLRLYKTCKVEPSFVDLFKANIHKFRTWAVTMKETPQGVFLYNWSIPDHERDRLAIESRKLSTAANGSMEIPVPEGLALDGYQKAGVEYILQRKATLLGDSMGLGKLNSINNLGLTPSGWRKMGDLKVGDQIIGSTGKAINITGVFPQGIKPLYRVTFSDGSSVTAGAEHLWGVDYHCGGKRWVRLVLTTEQIMTRPKIGKLDLAKTDLYLPMLSGPVEFNANAVPLDPYVLGQLIANGGMADGTPSLTTNAHDWPEVRLRISGMVQGTPRDKPGCVKTSFLGIIQIIRNLGLNVLSGSKFIPRIYLESSPDNRIALLQGLMDADGSISKTQCRVNYHTTSHQLAKDVMELVEGLGGISSIRTYDRTPEGKTVEYQVRLRLPEWVKPFSISRKASRYKPGNRATPVRTFTSVEYSHDEEAVCIAVDAPDKLYVTEHCILTHNTVQAIGAINAINHRAGKKALQNILIVCPADLRLNWNAELRRWLVDRYSIGIVDKGVFDDAEIVIISYESLGSYEKQLGRLWDLVIADEAHYICNPKAKRTANLIGYQPKRGEDASKFKAGIQSLRRLAMTGTPIPNKVENIFTILHWLDPVTWPKRGPFVHRYVMEGNHWRLGELQSLMRQKVLIRREKKDVLKDLPPKRRTVHVLSCDPSQMREVTLVAESGAMKKWMDKFIDAKVTFEISKALEDFIYREAKLAYESVMAQCAGASFELFHAIGRAKVDGAIEIFKRQAEETHKFIIFVHHKDVCDRIAAVFPTSLRITGSESMEERHKAVALFQGENDFGPIIVSIPCAKGINLTKASIEYFLEGSWLPGDLAQAEDRAHRRGQTECVMITHLVLEGSIDISRAEALIRKQTVIDLTMDINPEAQYEQRDPVMPLPGVTLNRDCVLGEVLLYKPDQIVELTEKARRIPMAQLDTAILHRIGNMTDRSRMGPLLKELVHRNQPSFRS